METSKSRRLRKRALIVPPVPDLPITAAEAAANRRMIAQLNILIAEQRQRNLDRRVLLAQQAARGVGPLVAHFQELGRRYSELLDDPPKPDLRVIEGGAA